MSTFAICSNLKELNHGGYRDPKTCARFRGAEWVPHFVRIAETHGHKVTTGSDALYTGFTRFQDTVVIQEEMNAHGCDLIRLGARPGVVMCLESPLYTPRFYDELANVKKIFPRQLLFHGGTDHLYFPSFDADGIPEPLPWEGRKFLCMVSANKHYSGLPQTNSPSFRWAMETQLQDFRFETITYFQARGLLDLFGRGWPKELGAECLDKIKTTQPYQFQIAYENGQYPGYVTEKIIDSLAAGTVPYYAGAPDILNYIPENLFVAAGSGLERLRQVDCMDMVRRGQNFLRGGEGRKYSFQGFAENVWRIVNA